MAKQEREKESYSCCGVGFSTKTEFEKHQSKLHAGAIGATHASPEHGGATTGAYEPVGGAG